MLRSKAVTLAVAGLMVFGLAACGDDKAASTDNTEQANTEQESADAEVEAAEADAADPGSELDLETAKEFVKITACTGTPSLSVTVEVTNPLDEPKEYYGQVNFLDGSGAMLTEGVFNTGTLEPGEKSAEKIPGANVYETVPKVTCELAEVKSDNPS